MSMTKTDYELLARCIHDRRDSNTGNIHALCAYDDLVHHLAMRLGVTNPKFDRTKFLQACGVQAPAKIGSQP